MGLHCLPMPICQKPKENYSIHVLAINITDYMYFLFHH